MFKIVSNTSKDKILIELSNLLSASKNVVEVGGKASVKMTNSVGDVFNVSINRIPNATKENGNVKGFWIEIIHTNSQIPGYLDEFHTVLYADIDKRSFLFSRTKSEVFYFTTNTKAMDEFKKHVLTKTKKSYVATEVVEKEVIKESISYIDRNDKINSYPWYKRLWEYIKLAFKM